MTMFPRVLVVGPEWVAGWTLSTAQGLRELGCAVEVFYYLRARPIERVHQWKKWLADCLGRKDKHTPVWLRASYWRWVGMRIEMPLLRTAKAFRPDLVLVLKGEVLLPRTLMKLKQTTGASTTVWWVDDPYAFERQCGLRNVFDCLPLYDRVFVFDRQYLAPLQEQGIERAEFLPCAADPALYRPQEVPEHDRGAYAARVSLIGAYFESRGEIVNELLKEPGLRIWGPGWEWFLRERLGDSAVVCYKGEALIPSEIAKVYASSLINLNTHHTQSQWGGLNSRAFEIPATGAFQLTDYVRGMEELLEPGREVAVYEKPYQVPELVRHYINDPESRERIARAGYERVIAQHTYRHRMTTVLNVL